MFTQNRKGARMAEQNETSTRLRESRQGATTMADRYLTFVLDEEKYGVDILNVKEIIGMQKTTHIPKTPVYVKGVMNLRGQIIPVVDLRLKLEMPETEVQMHTAIIIINIHETNIGFIVDQVDEVAAIGEEQLSEPPKFGSKIDTNFIRNMAKYRDDVVMILDLERVFDADEMSGLESIAKDTQ